MNTKSTFIIGGVVIVALIGVLIATVINHHSDMSPITLADPSMLPGLQTGTSTWPAEITQLRSRLAAENLPALAEEGTVLHIHQHLDLFVDGKPVPVPAGIGINEEERFISPIHVHDNTGIIHVESPFQATFTLGQFFDIWGVAFNEQGIGGYRVDATHALTVYVNGVLYQGDPRMLPLAPHQEIVIAYGTSDELPSPVPASFTFPQGY